MIHKDEAVVKGIKIIDSKQAHNPLFENLKANFPQTIKDNQVDLRAITTLLGLDTKANIQGYELTFTGKALANALYSAPAQKLLKFEELFQAKDTPQDNAQNFIIKGDNLDVLKILKSAYSEKIKMIYIDPPYNTKKDNFIYPDNFRKDYKAILQEVGLLEIDDEGNEIESETLQFFKNIQSTRTHSGWLSFMLPRLKLARDLLREDGVIFISIDDNEQANLKILCDEIFGEENFVCNFIWQKNFAPKNDNKYISESTDYILCYSKYKNYFNRNLLPRIDKHVSSYSNPDNDKRGDWTSGSILVTTFSEKSVYEIIAPNGKKHLPPKGRSWRYSKETFENLLEDNRIWFGRDGNGVPRVKRFLSEMSNGIVPQNLLLYKEVGSSQSGNKDLQDIFQIQLFDFPKPISLIKHFLKLSTSVESDDIILDFFAGSGTTAQAVMELNAEDKGNRKFILAQIDEEIMESKSKTAYDFCKNELSSKNPVISDITIERVKRAGGKIANTNPDFNVNFNVLSLSDKPELITDKQGALELSNNSELSPFDKALNLALQSGKTLDRPLKTIFENKLYQCEDCLYLIDCDKDVLDFLRNTQNEYIFIDGLEDLSLENFLNLNSSLNDRLRIVY
ncbi:TPA: site-specific DNA-methyltransferase [Campylobacter coli]|nr:site-specific DNA-methyltransferase [Campylobacter coli]HEH4746825.1 site-specific DNA-methyltransferase [Campylobacter coli]HEH4748318.1 site-specific DNA-methyltransferase [Campylobacter coli]